MQNTKEQRLPGENGSLQEIVDLPSVNKTTALGSYRFLRFHWDFLQFLFIYWYFL